MLRPKRSVLEDFDEPFDYGYRNTKNCNTTPKKKCNCCYNEDMNIVIDDFMDDFNEPCLNKSNICDDCGNFDYFDFDIPEKECPITMPLAMAYVTDQEFDCNNLYDCKTALLNGTLFHDLNMEFKGGHNYE